MIAHPHIIRQNLRPDILIGLFDEVRALGKILFRLEVIENILPLGSSAFIIQKDGFHQMDIQKRRKHITSGVFFIIIQL